jgi:hypothetical protein
MVQLLSDRAITWSLAELQYGPSFLRDPSLHIIRFGTKSVHWLLCKVNEYTETHTVLWELLMGFVYCSVGPKLVPCCLSFSCTPLIW